VSALVKWADEDVRFFTGLHQVNHTKHVSPGCLSISRTYGRQKPVEGKGHFGDSKAFTTIAEHGGYPDPPEHYAREVHRLQSHGIVDFAVVSTQDYMCEPIMLAKTGLTIDDHQRLTIERYDAILAEFLRLYDVTDQRDLPFEFLPVLQGWTPDDYVRHLEMYGDRVQPGMWVGVGSVCKRNANVASVEDILSAIKGVRPDLRLHGFWVEDNGAPELPRQATALQRRQHGLVVRSSQSADGDPPRSEARVRTRRLDCGGQTPPAPTPTTPPRSKRLAGGRRLRSACRSAAQASRTTQPSRPFCSLGERS